MILLEIKKYLQEKKQASLQDIAAKFDLTEDAVRAMLMHWERKGMLEQIKKSCCERKCSDCSSPCSVTFRWKDDQ